MANNLPLYFLPYVIGDLGRELKSLITMMDQEEDAEAEPATANSRKTPLRNVMMSKISSTNSNKESPV